MSKIIIAGAGGAPAENVIKSLIEGDKKNEVIGMGSEPMDLMLSMARKKYFVPYAVDVNYKSSLLKLLNSEKPDLVHFQNDIEIREASRMREDIIDTGTKIYMPSKETIEICVDKSKSSLIWQNEGIKIPKTIVLNEEKDLKKAFETLANKQGKIWIRAAEGGGGKGALPADNYEFAKIWIDRFNGWGNFTAAELLATDTVTWLSIWYEGELVVAQSRKRNSWNFGNRTLSGVTGITRVGETYSDETVNKVAMDSILSIDKKPNGIYGVDMTYDFNGFPNPTEINISRFFTTVYFFTKAGLNMPQIFADIVLHNKFPKLQKKINPLPDGLMWIRGMDREALLTNMNEIKSTIVDIK
ncbi:carbamoyl-phosphate synthase large subunit [Sporomusaceae bacterium BoRhaA]|uniref:carboxylate--amine ligase n=1 Tax=Pelorhabdus rhamnosifermentans TaxID=2772457 RepID=UPI001C0617D7|nr:carboxylate--amine ligase [Pelorhabdus rhamnosifermentans]MBU2699045.1 carbamoyl-phosphate synthase large subunit [Pelorhabdus rhamnosifermentans]